MKTLNLFPTRLHRFDNPNPRTDEVISLIEEFEPAQRSGGDSSQIRVETTDGILHLEPRFKFLMDWFKSCVQQYKDHYDLDCDDFDISVCWANKSSPGRLAAHHIHDHNLAFISAVYYVTSGSPTVFLDPFKSKGGICLDVAARKNTEVEREVYGEPGMLVLFPSWLPHYSKPHTGNYPRYTISFNILPVGNVNKGMYGFPMAHITLNRYE